MQRSFVASTALCLLLAGCATTSNEPLQVWRNEKGQDILALYIRSTSGASFKADCVGVANITIDNQGFVSIQVPLTNKSPFRKTANVGWEWSKADGMVARSPLGNSLRAVNIAGGDTQLLRSVSSAAEPRVVTLTLYPPN